MDNVATQTAELPKVLFVDDEQRVLNSMRIMFRRRFEMYFASDGMSALEIVRQNDIDVVVADHRMPQMTGVEVLTAVRTMSPRTVRILLTGYADLDAIEGSINDGEVFRFLTKPCAPQQLRATLALAAEVSEKGHADNEPVVEPEQRPLSDVRADEPVAPPMAPAPAPQAQPQPQPRPQPQPQPQPQLTRTVTEHELAETDVIDHAEVAAVVADPQQHADPTSLEALSGSGVVVFSVDQNVIDSIHQAASARFPVHVASNVVQVVKILKEHRPGVLVTDITNDRNTIQVMTNTLKQHLPELVTIIVSEHRDALDMIWQLQPSAADQQAEAVVSTPRNQCIREDVVYNFGEMIEAGLINACAEPLLVYECAEGVGRQTGRWVCSDSERLQTLLVQPGDERIGMTVQNGTQAANVRWLTFSDNFFVARPPNSQYWWIACTQLDVACRDNAQMWVRSMDRQPASIDPRGRASITVARSY